MPMSMRNHPDFRTPYQRRQAPGRSYPLMAAKAAGSYLAGYAAKRAIGYAASKAAQAYKSYSRPTPVTVVRTKRSKRVFKRRPKTLKKQVKVLQKQMNNMTSTLTYRFNDVFRLSSSANQASYANHLINDVSVIETVLAQLRFFDPSNPGTLIQGSGATGTYNRKFQVRGFSTYHFRNNYQVPVSLKVYKYQCKDDTNINPITAFTNGLADIGNPTSSSTVVYPSDSTQLTDLWSSKGCTSWMLKPGQEKTYTISSPFFDYDPADTDAHNLAYQRNNKVCGILIRIQGVPAHDKTTVTQLGFIGTGIDYSEKQTYTVKYNSGGPDLTFLYVNDSSDAMTAGAVVSQIVVDNQEFSTA